VNLGFLLTASDYLEFWLDRGRFSSNDSAIEKTGLNGRLCRAAEQFAGYKDEMAHLDNATTRHAPMSTTKRTKERLDMAEADGEEARKK
jgi:hypothetical protein